MKFTPLTLLATLILSALGAAIPTPAALAGIALAREAKEGLGRGGYNNVPGPEVPGTDGRGGYNRRAETPGTDGRGGYNKVSGEAGTNGRGGYN
ncbi:hypothetical protein VTL71DRAFT_6685 [Oculimacula yallundae]|uniref:Uncharacterized protein n=1 Tax=Oculimacula yallundae TaxID=86028 RepID=A0ABR4BZC4_9HELO